MKTQNISTKRSDKKGPSRNYRIEKYNNRSERRLAELSGGTVSVNLRTDQDHVPHLSDREKRDCRK